MSDNERRKPGLYRASPESIPAFEEAIARHHNPSKQALIQTWSGSDNNEWDPWKITFEHGRRSQFDGILDFFVNVPSLKSVLTDASITDQWLWNAMEERLLAEHFPTSSELVRMLRLRAGADALITEGWLLRHQTGHVDSITTWAETSYLLGTEGYFAYIQLYRQQIH